MLFVAWNDVSPDISPTEGRYLDKESKGNLTWDNFWLSAVLFSGNYGIDCVHNQSIPYTNYRTTKVNARYLRPI